MSLFKEKIYSECMRTLSSKVQELYNALKDISESADNESKSTAGDKHETGRAMLQLEQEKLGKQLKDLEAQEAEFRKIDISKKSDHAVKGSLILTDKGYLFLSVGLGKIKVDDKTVYALSVQSPLGSLLAGAKAGNKIEMNGVIYKISEVS